MSWVNLTNITAVVNALNPILSWVAPIAMASIFLYFIRSFFD